MSTVYNKVRDNYSIVPNRIINDKDASIQAKMVYIYMLSKPDNWEYNLKEMSNSLGVTRQTIRKHLDDLISLGWITDLGQSKTDSGKFANCEFIINDLLTREEATVLNSTVLKNTVTEKLNTNKEIVLNKERKRRNNIINKDRVKEITWKESYEEYTMLVDDAETRLVSDDEYRAKYESWFENIDYVKTVMKTADWWRSEVGWNYCRRKRTSNPDLYMSLRNNLDRNRIYRPFKALSNEDKVRTMDEQLELFKAARNNK